MTEVTPRIPAVAVDASVAAKWLLRDEDNVDAADSLLHSQAAGAIRLTAPQQIEVEVANSDRKAVPNGRLTLDSAGKSLQEWLDLTAVRIELAPNAALLPLALRRSYELGITLFDALYVALAETFELTLVTADSRLLRSPAGALPLVRSLSSYSIERQTEREQ